MTFRVAAAKPRQAPGQHVKICLLVIAALSFVMLHQAIVLSHAFQNGLLSGLHPWDDCMILERPLWPLAALKANPTWHGILGVFEDYAPRGPIGELQAFFALLVSDGNLRAPYYLNGWAQALAVLCLIGSTWRLRLATTTALLILVVAAPMATAALLSLKADYKGGLLIAVAIFVLHEAVLGRSRVMSVLGTAILSLAMTAKLTAFFLPVWAVCTLVVFELLRHGPAAHDRDVRLWRYSAAMCRACWRERRRVVGLALLLAGPFVLLFGWALTDGLYWYIRLALGTSWNDGLTVSERAVFYLRTPGGPVLASSALFGGYLLWRAIAERRPDQLASLAATLVVAAGVLLPFVMASTSGAEYGAYFSGTLLGAALIYIRMVSERSDRAALGSLAAVMLAVLVFPPERRTHDVAGLRESKQTLIQVVDDIRALGGTVRPRVRMMFEDGVAGFPNLSLLHFVRTNQPLDVGRIDYLDPPGRLRRELAEADIVLTLRPTGDVQLAGYRLMATTVSPATADLARSDHLVATDGRFELSRTYPWRGSELRTYVRRAPTSP